jgi:hypothetical protein
MSHAIQGATNSDVGLRSDTTSIPTQLRVTKLVAIGFLSLLSFLSLHSSLLFLVLVLGSGMLTFPGSNSGVDTCTQFMTYSTWRIELFASIYMVAPMCACDLRLLD